MSDEDDTSDIAFEFKDMGLGELVSILAKDSPIVKVGILGNGEPRPGEQTNADIGRRHEFGIGLPQRSFLRMPLMDNLEKQLNEKGAFTEDAMKAIIEAKSLVPWLKKVGVISEEIIQIAFETGGYGKWRASNMKNKKTKLTLVESSQLRKSITSEVSDGD